ncbi:hypothetical protein TERTU_1276 [Teredinibacter turnerae T7901]|uniref:Uncharacterized protein n=1 Tax=Teredinibacter turnerae (strain ATCC 39867 / T7901) TaxID=377629 RepID=C5BRW0_TERTT|nr:hypothetical protein TERTU_1276 [Teredinibacter turnerae T7901]
MNHAIGKFVTIYYCMTSIQAVFVFINKRLPAANGSQAIQLDYCVFVIQ